MESTDLTQQPNTLKPRGRGRGRRRGRNTSRGTFTEKFDTSRPQHDSNHPLQSTESRRGRNRGRGQNRSDQPVSTQPRYIKVSDLEPDTRAIYLNLKVAKEPELIKHLVYPDGRETKEWSVLVGDETGLVNLRITTEDISNLLKPGVSLIIRNGFIMMKDHKFMNLATNVWGKIEIISDSHTFEVNSAKNFSQIEYEQES